MLNPEMKKFINETANVHFAGRYDVFTSTGRLHDALLILAKFGIGLDGDTRAMLDELKGFTEAYRQLPETPAFMPARTALIECVESWLADAIEAYPEVKEVFEALKAAELEQVVDD